MKRRTVLGALGTAVGATTTAACLGSSTPTDVLLGVYPGPDRARIRPFERWLGRSFGVTTLYVDATTAPGYRRRFVRDVLTTQWEGGRVPMVTWQPFPRSDGKANVTEAIVEGDYHDVVTGWATELGAWLAAGSGDRVLYFRPFPEMNGTWVPWGAGSAAPGTFVDAWRTVYEAFGSAGLTGNAVQWLWNPNASEHGPHPTEAYYPGDSYVDWLGVDGYNFGDGASTTWRSPATVFDSMLTRLEDLADKPVAIPEFGSSSYRNGRHRPAAKANWLDEAFDLVEHRGVRLACWFNVDKETDWAVFGGARGTSAYEDSVTGRTFSTYEAYRDRVMSDRYAGGTDSSPPTDLVCDCG